VGAVKEYVVTAFWVMMSASWKTTRTRRSDLQIASSARARPIRALEGAARS
jgi:hypothetical protein